MTARSPRFEICRGDDGWWARFRAANGRIVWVTETYRHRGGAIKAINVLVGFGGAPQWIATNHSAAVRDVGHGIEVDFGRHGLLEVREVDERLNP